MFSHFARGRVDKTAETPIADDQFAADLISGSILSVSFVPPGVSATAPQALE